MSKRNGMVTRWSTDTLYELQWFSAADRQIHKVQSIATGKKTVADVKKIALKALKPDEVIVQIDIIGYDKRLYAMPEGQYYTQARIISTEHVDAIKPVARRKGQEGKK